MKAALHTKICMNLLIIIFFAVATYDVHSELLSVTGLLTYSFPDTTELEELTASQLYSRYTQESLDLKQCTVKFPLFNDDEVVSGYIGYTDSFEQPDTFAASVVECNDPNDCEEFRRVALAECYLQIKQSGWVLSWPALGRQKGDQGQHLFGLAGEDTPTRDSVTLTFHLGFHDEMEIFINNICSRFGYDSFDCDYFKAQLYTASLNDSMCVVVGLNVPVREYRRVFQASDLFTDPREEVSVKCPSRQRHLITHHKSGTNIALSFLGTINRQFSSSCWTDLHVGGIPVELGGHDMENAQIVHFIRNPWDIILSGYFYHSTKTELMVQVPMSMARHYTSKDHCEFPSVHAVYEYIINHSLEYPYPGEMSYKDYLNSISPELGVRLEYIRSVNGNLGELVRTMSELRELSREGSGASVASVCMSSLMKHSPPHEPANDWQQIQAIVTDHLDIPLSEDMAFQLATAFFSEQATTIRMAHTTARSPLRLSLLNELRAFDKSERFSDEGGGLVLSYENSIGCLSE